MNYDSTHADRALRILRDHISKVKRRDQYFRLMSIAESSDRWHEARECFNDIRVGVTKPMEQHGALPIETNFAMIAEFVAKTLYNCSEGDAPFDASSYKKLLRAEQQLINDEDSYTTQDDFGLGRGTTPKSLGAGVAQIVFGWFKRRQ